MEPRGRRPQAEVSVKLVWGIAVESLATAECTALAPQAEAEVAVAVVVAVVAAVAAAVATPRPARRRQRPRRRTTAGRPLGRRWAPSSSACAAFCALPTPPSPPNFLLHPSHTHSFPRFVRPLRSVLEPTRVMWMEADVVELRPAVGMLLVHYRFWSMSFNEWLRWDGDRVAPRGTHTFTEAQGVPRVGQFVDFLKKVRK